MGKSRLVEAAAAMAVRHGLRVLHGRAVDHQRHLETDNLTPRHRRTLTRAPAACWTDLGWNHDLCHGDFGNREVLHAAVEAGAAPPDLTMPELDARLITSIERHGPVCDVPGAAFPPRLFTGITGIAYQLLRMHPHSDIPSVLLPRRTSPTPRHDSASEHTPKAWPYDQAFVDGHGSSRTLIVGSSWRAAVALPASNGQPRCWAQRTA